MLDIFLIMQLEAGEERRLAAYYPEGSRRWKIHIKQAEELEAKVRTGTKSIKKILNPSGNK